MRLLIALLVVGVAPLNAAPLDAEAQARQRFERGQRLSAEHKFIEALAEFSAGYELSGKPLFLFNMAECARSSGDRARAQKGYERYLDADPNGKLADKARERLRELGAPPPAAAPVAAPAPAPVPPPPPAPAPPPPSAAPAVAVAPVVNTALTAPPPPASKPVWKRPALWIGIGVAASAIIVAGAVGGYYATRDSGGCSGSCVDFRK
jgi:hypothetical protein